MYNAAQAEPTGLMSHARWWTIIDGLSLGSQYRTDLERLARRNVSDLDSSKGTLSFLLDEGVALMAVNLLPFFQTLIIKCGEFGVITAARISRSDVDKSGWANLRSNANERYVIARGTSQDMLVLQHQSALHVDTKTVLNVTGAGDSLVGSVLADLVESPTLFHSPASSRQTLRRAQRAAVLTLQSRHAVSPELSRLSRL
jgi:pseudouridine-5'-phosphate glycosidase/pseudouridine kinase